jgi:glycerol uptake facilitator-like aquaporin
MRSRLLAEFLGTASIVTAVLGAGFMVQNLQAEPALGLFMIATGVAGVLFVSISVFGPYSGAHFNPIVSLAFYSLKQFDSKELLSYVAAQLVGALSGAVLANLMFGESLAFSEISRISTGTFIGEIVASAGLVLLILQLVQIGKINLIAPAVALWILAGHIFTSSTSFANPAVTIGRIFSLAPSGIDFYSAAWFVLAQLIGMFISVAIFTQFRKVKL